MSLHNFCRRIIGLLKFTCNALIYVFLSIESNFNLVLSDINVVCKLIFIIFIELFFVNFT
jgi:hypothetical protein